MLVAPLFKSKLTLETASAADFCAAPVIKTKTFDDAELGVMLAVMPVVAITLVLLVALVVIFALTTCNTFPPAAGAAHFNPVGETELSATKWGMFLEQSLRIVPGLLTGGIVSPL